MCQSQTESQALPLWLSPCYAKRTVQGNLTTLSDCPKTVEEGEWLAYQVAEHYRILWSFVRIVHEKESDGDSICNPTLCQDMSAGRHSYTWLNVDQQPVDLSAYECMKLLQHWISAKVHGSVVFPTDPSGASSAHNPRHSISPVPSEKNWLGSRSGFPERFAVTCKVIFLQMFRIYAHLYWNHFIDPFYHLDLEKQLNSCFSYFLQTATSFDMLQRHELEPMQDLVNVWAVDGFFPVESKVYKFADLERGHFLRSLATTT